MNRFPSVLSLSGALLALPAHAIDLQPGDVRAPDANQRAVQLIWQNSERSGFYVKGEKQRGNNAFSSSTGQLRLSQSFEIAGMPALAYANLPFGNVQPKGDLANLRGDSGLGDLSFLLAVWPYVDREAKRYFGIGAYLVTPTGSYDADRGIFNMGENRYRSALQLGYQSMLSERLMMMAAFDTVWFGKNDRYFPQRVDLEQKPLHSSQLGFSYTLTPRYTIASNYFYSEGGEQEVAGIERDNRTKVHRYQLYFSAFMPYGRLTLQYGGDIRTENGFKEEQRITLRYGMRF